MKKRLNLLIWVFFGTALSVLYVKSKVVDYQKTERVLEVLRQIKHADSNLDESLLKTRYYIIKDYDPINQYLSEVQIALNSLDKGENSIRNSGQKMINERLDEFTRIFSEKKEELDRFKGQNAILKNAIHLLPISVEKVKNQKIIKDIVLDSLLKNILLYNLAGEESIKKICEGQLMILKSENRKKTNLELEILTRHSENILLKKKGLDDLVESILSKNTGTALDRLSAAFTIYYNSYLNTANIYRLLLYTFSVLLLFYIAYILVRLLLSSISVKMANEKLLITNKAYERFVPKESLSILSKNSVIDLKLGDGIRREMSVLFSDIRSFTAMSEKMTPEENFGFINSYLKIMGPIVRRHNGFIDKYIGDAIMALFPGKSEDAVQAGISMLKELKKYNSENRNSAERSPIQIGIGVHIGDMIFGTVGENNRMESTVISDAVNLGSRIEGLTKHYGISLLISENIYEIIHKPDDYKVRHIDRVTVKGKNRPIGIYEVYDADSEELIAKKDETKEALEKAIHLFYSKNPLEAKKILEKASKKFKEDLPIKILLNRCNEWIPKMNDSNADWETSAGFDFK
ncbi:MAG TPA: adenylate/guanylate cyclase domain-containing protein [Leptospiraceae bacterium]|nr:adenylate/guanylate cyclase domain-containing protein [Leptospiraceae bacterium]